MRGWIATTMQVSLLAQPDYVYRVKRYSCLYFLLFIGRWTYGAIIKIEHVLIGEFEVFRFARGMLSLWIVLEYSVAPVQDSEQMFDIKVKVRIEEFFLQRALKSDNNVCINCPGI